MAKTILVALVFFLHVQRNSAAAPKPLPESEQYTNVYYDPTTRGQLKAEVEDSARFPFSRIGFRGLPCSCEEMACGCCAGINITSLKFDQRACTNVTFDPTDFEIRMNVLMNDNSILSTKISAKNPPPVCMPMPYVPVINFCVRFFDIHMRDNNMHACMDFETRITSSPVFVMHFDCVKIGGEGVTWVRPPGSSDASQPDNGPTIAEPEVYDEVNFEPNDSPILNNLNDTIVLTQEDEDKIGQLKLR